MKNASMMLVLLGLLALPLQTVSAQDAVDPQAATDQAAAADQTTTAVQATAEEAVADQTDDLDKEELKSEVNALQENILANETLMKEIEELLKDDDIVKLLSNPDLVAAITSYDPAQIEANPSVQELMKNPKVNELIEKIGALYESQNAAEGDIENETEEEPVTQ